MDNFEQKPQDPAVDEALNTLEASQGQNSAPQFSAKDPNMADRVAAYQQILAEKAKSEQINQVKPDSQAYAEQQAPQTPQTPPRGTQATEIGSGVSFNANGDPNAPEGNVSVVDGTQVPDQEQVDDYFDADENIECLVEDNKELKAEVLQLQEQLAQTKKDAAKDHDAMLRALAEADNVRKRSAQDVERAHKFALEKFVRALLPVYDALEKALEMSDRTDESIKVTIEGVENTLNLLLKEFASFGVEIVDPTGKPFDPNFHQAIQMVPSPEVPSNHVLQTVQKGFLLNGRVVRPAFVIVSNGAGA